MRNVLVVDDNQSDLVIAKTVVTKAGYQAIACQDAIAALEYVGSYPLDLIIVDWNMPQLNGLDFLKRIRAQVVKENIPVMFMSGKNEVREIKTAIQAGANDYLIKPINPQTFEQKIKKIIEETKQEEFTNVPNQHPAADIQLEFDFKLLKISDQSIQFLSKVSFPMGMPFVLNLNLAKPCSLKAVELQIKSVEAQGSEYVITGKILNLDEVMLKKIRMIRSSLTFNNQ